jgi:hypothetical protein
MLNDELRGKATMQFSLRALWIVLTMCGIEAGLVAATSKTPVAAVPAGMLAYYIVAVPFTSLYNWLRSSRAISLDESFALSTVGIVYAVTWLAVCLLVLVIVAASVSLFHLIMPAL